MKQLCITALALATSLAIAHADEPADSAQWVKLLGVYVETLQNDVQHNKDLRIRKMLEAWRQPLFMPYDSATAVRIKSEIVVFQTDTLLTPKEQQRQQALAIGRLFDSYANEAQRMVKAFEISDPNMLTKLEYCTSPSNVHSFSQLLLRKWFNDSGLATFVSSSIPYLASTAEKLTQMMDDLCDDKKATPELLRTFLDTKYRITTSLTTPQKPDE